MPKLQSIDHPVFGRLIPDQWNSNLMCFREFPDMRPFCTLDPEETLRGVSPKLRKFVENWRDQPEKLAKVCRNFEVIYALQAMSVYEVSVSLDKTAKPTDEQSAAYRFFEDNEEAICRNVCNALFRYYQTIRDDDDEEWFEMCECPKIDSQEELFPLVRFDGFSIDLSHCEGLSVLCLGWGPDWDPEHGLQMFVWRDQVVGIGGLGIGDTLSPSDYSLWNSSHMTDDERAALERLQAGIVQVSPYEE